VSVRNYLTQIYKIPIEFVRKKMKTRIFVIVAIMTAMLIGATALATTDSAFAGKDEGKTKYEKSQAASQANACGNGNTPTDIFCQNAIAQIQGEGNAVIVLPVQAH
jgi:hypothetical protein